MRKNPYESFSKKELILRDQLAIDRTILANERTFLSYIRTSLAIMAVGATLIHFFNESWIRIFGGFLVFLGLTIALIGLIKYKKMDQSIDQIK